MVIDGNYSKMEVLGSDIAAAAKCESEPADQRMILGKGLHSFVYTSDDITCNKYCLDVDSAIREITITGLMNHPSIIKFHEVEWMRPDSAELPNGLRLFIDGAAVARMKMQRLRPISDWLKDSPPPEQFIKIIYDLASAMRHMHLQGFVHCDIKPANIMIELQRRPLHKDASDDHLHTEDDGAATQHAAANITPVLCDFGIAMSAGYDNYRSEQRLFGWGYRAPELNERSGKPCFVMPSADVWALGCVITAMLGDPLMRIKDDAEINIDDATPQLCRAFGYEGAFGYSHYASGRAMAEREGRLTWLRRQRSAENVLKRRYEPAVISMFPDRPDVGLVIMHILIGCLTVAPHRRMTTADIMQAIGGIRDVRAYIPEGNFAAPTREVRASVSWLLPTGVTSHRLSNYWSGNSHSDIARLTDKLFEWAAGLENIPGTTEFIYIACVYIIRVIFLRKRAARQIGAGILPMIRDVVVAIMAAAAATNVLHWLKLPPAIDNGNLCCD